MMGRLMLLAGIVLASLVIVACAGSENSPGTTSTTGGGGGPQETTWERVGELVREGRVEAVSQYHSLRVEIRLTDGTEYWATEPQIDAIFGVVEEAPNRDSIVIATE